MVGKSTLSRKIFMSFNTVILLAVAAATIYPLIYVLAASFTGDSFLIQGKVSIIPNGFQTDAYERLLQYKLIWRAYANTLFYTVSGVAIGMFLTVLGAYVLSRKQFFGKKFFTIFTAATIWFNAGMIPNYLLVDKLKIYNTIWAMLLPMAITTYNMIVMKTFFEQIPDSLEEAAKIDGANDIDVLFKIFLPCSIPSLVTIALFYAVYHWNAYLPAMLYLRDKTLWPLQLVLRDLVILGNTSEMLGSTSAGREGLKYAAIVISILPMIIAYPFMQKYLVKGMMVGAEKG